MNNSQCDRTPSPDGRTGHVSCFSLFGRRLFRRGREKGSNVAVFLEEVGKHHVWRILALLLAFMAAGAVGCSPDGGDSRNAVHQKIQKTLEQLDILVRIHPQTAVNTANQLLTTLDKDPDPDLEIQVCNILNLGYTLLGKFQDAEKNGTNALKLAEQLQNNIRRAEALLSLGNLYWRWSRDSEAFAALFAAQDLLGATPGEEKLKGRLDNLYGLMSWRSFNLAEALQHFIRAEQSYSASHYSYGLASVYNNIGLVAIEMNDGDMAKEYLLKAERLFSQAGSEGGLSMVYVNLALVHENKDELTQALALNNKALTFAEKVSDLSIMGIVSRNIGNVYFKMQDYGKAARCFDMSLKYQLEANDQRGVATAHYHIAKNLLRAGRLREAETAVRKSLDISDSHRYNREKSDALIILSEIQQRKGDGAGALNSYKHFLEVTEILRKEADGQRFNGLAAAYNAEVKNRDIQLLKQSELARNLALTRAGTKNAVLFAVLLLTAASTLVLYTLYRFKIRLQNELEQEITSHEQTQRRLRDNENMFRSLAEHAPLGIFILQNGALEYVNLQIAIFSGYPVKRMIGQPPEEFICSDDADAAREFFSQEPDDLSAGRLVVRIRKRDGELILAEIHATRIQYEEKPAILGTVSDLTLAEKLRQELWEQQEHESVARLAGGVAHDFNNLLAVISGYLNLVLDSHIKPGSHAGDRLQNAERAARKVAEMIRSILEQANEQPEPNNHRNTRTSH